MILILIFHYCAVIYVCLGLADNPANTRRCSNVELMLGHGLLRWSNINPYSAGIDFSRQNLTSVDVRF